MGLHIFGYGSLIWRPDFPHVARQPALLRGWARRFWQGSTDHRGVPGAPGRVVTLVEQAGARCHGVYYTVRPDAEEAALDALDHREKGGYERRWVQVEPLTGGAPVEALAYFATPLNPNYLGPADEAQIAETVRGSRGPSGPNLEYVLRLHAALVDMGARDPHVDAIVRALGQTGGQSTAP